MQVKYRNRPPENPFARENYLVPNQFRKKDKDPEPASMAPQFDIKNYADRYPADVQPSNHYRTASNDVVIKALSSVNPFKTPKRLKDVVREHRDQYEAEQAKEERAYMIRSTSRDALLESRIRGRSAVATEPSYLREGGLRTIHLTPYLATSNFAGPHFPPVHQPNVNMSPSTYYHLMGAQLPSINTPSFLDANNFKSSYYDTPSNNDMVFVYDTKQSLQRTSKQVTEFNKNPVGTMTSQKIAGYESEESEVSPYEAPRNPAATFRGTAPVTSQASIDNRITYESEPEEESPQHPATIEVRGKQYFSINLLRR